MPPSGWPISEVSWFALMAAVAPSGGTHVANKGIQPGG